MLSKYKLASVLTVAAFIAAWMLANIAPLSERTIDADPTASSIDLSEILPAPIGQTIVSTTNSRVREQPAASRRAMVSDAPSALPDAPPESAWIHARELATSELTAELESTDRTKLAYAIEALDRRSRCSRYMKHPEAREQEQLGLDFETRETLRRIWAKRDAQCQGLDDAVRETAIRTLIEAADAGEFEAIAQYYRWGPGDFGERVRNPAMAQEFVARMRRYISPIEDDIGPRSLDLLFSVYRDGLVYPRDHSLSATYRFASYYHQGLPAAEIDRRRLAWGRTLTDAEIQQAEQAGYELFLECCAR